MSAERRKHERINRIPYDILVFNRNKITSGDVLPHPAFVISGPGGARYLQPVIDKMIKEGLPGVIVAPYKITQKIKDQYPEGPLLTPTNDLGILFASKLVVDLSGENESLALEALETIRHIKKRILYIEDGPDHAKKRVIVFKKKAKDLTVLAYSKESAASLQGYYPWMDKSQILATGRPDFDFFFNLPEHENHSNGRKRIILAGIADDELTVDMVEKVLNAIDLETATVTLSLHPRSTLKLADLKERFGNFIKIHSNGTTLEELIHSDLVISTGESTVARMAGFAGIPALRITNNGANPHIKEDNTIPVHPSHIANQVEKFTANAKAITKERERLEQAFHSHLDGRATQRVYDAIVN